MDAQNKVEFLFDLLRGQFTGAAEGTFAILAISLVASSFILATVWLFKRPSPKSRTRQTK